MADLSTRRAGVAGALVCRAVAVAGVTNVLASLAIAPANVVNANALLPNTIAIIAAGFACKPPRLPARRSTTAGPAIGVALEKRDSSDGGALVFDAGVRPGGALVSSTPSAGE
jgi:hypothetical protein